MENQNLESVKEQLIETINKKLEDKIIEQSNANLIIKLINRADTVKEAVDIAALGTTYKKTGFHFDKRLDKIVNNGRIKYFKKNMELSFSDGSEVVGASSTSPNVNKLIIGDNFDALQNLLIQYKNSIDVIYIDPPYGKDSMGQFAETNYNNALTRDNLLSMLYPRLVLAKELLSDDGVIFCSIDDRNYPYIKCMMDDIFYENNFIQTFIWRKKYGGGKGAHYAVDLHEYIICFAKNISNIDDFLLNRNDEQQEIFKLEDEFLSERGKYYIRPLKSGLAYRKNLIYPIKCPNGKCIETQWICAKETFEQIKDEGRIVFKLLKDGTYNVYKKFYENDRGGLVHPDSIIYDIAYNQNGKEELKAIFNIKEGRDIPFQNPKPVELIKHLINMLNFSNEITIFDFFAGSGTTGQAVLELNKQDGGSRQFILCQLNEITDTTPNGIVKDVTSKRLKRVMTGECYDGNKEFDWIKKNEPLGGSLDVYEIADVANNETTEGQTPFDVIDETLYGKEKFTNLQDKIDWVCSNFENCQKELKE